MVNEETLPEGVNRMEGGVPFCPNCSQPMRPVASVDTTPRPRVPGGPSLTIEQMTQKVIEIHHEVAELAEDLEQKKSDAADAKKAYDGRVIKLRLALDRLERVCAGEAIPADRDLIDLADEAEDETRCASVHDVDGAAVQCAGITGHGGPHGHGDVSWEDDAAAMRAANLTIAEQFRQRLAQLLIVVTVEEIDAWSLDDYNIAVRYIERLEAKETLDDSDQPAFLSIEIPEHVDALHRMLWQLGIAVDMATVCGWTPTQRDEAHGWSTAEAQESGQFERPAFIPAPAADATPLPLSRSGKGRTTPRKKSNLRAVAATH